MKTPLLFTRLLLLCLVAALPLAFSACDKDEEDTAPNVAELIKGNWTATAVNVNYYANTGMLAHQERDEITGVTYYFKEDSLTVYSVPDKSSTSAKYRLSQNEGKDYISITTDRETREYLILKLTKEELVWQGKYPNINYIKDGDRRTAASATYTQEFRR